MNVIIDSNVWLSYLVDPKAKVTIVEVVNICLTNKAIQLIVPEITLAEVERIIANNPYFAQRVEPENWNHLKELLSTLASIVASPPLARRIGRDPKDEYLLATAQMYDVDYLVSGDKDLEIPEVQKIVKAVNPSEFLHIVLKHQVNAPPNAE